MKKIFLIFMAVVFTSFSYSQSSVASLLDKAKSCYAKGDINGALFAINSAERLINQNIKIKPQYNTAPSNKYKKISSWSTIQKKPSKYEGEKVKVSAQNYGITPDGNLWIFGVSPLCSYNEDLRDTLQNLIKEQKYTFYGTVVWLNSTIGPVLHVELVE